MLDTDTKRRDGRGTMGWGVVGADRDVSQIEVSVRPSAAGGGVAPNAAIQVETPAVPREHRQFRVDYVLTSFTRKI